MVKKPQTVDELVRQGGRAKFEKYGARAYSDMGKKGGNKLKEERGSEYFKKIRQIGIAKQKKKKNTSSVDHYSSLLSGDF